jgi:hypothetical protein
MESPASPRSFRLSPANRSLAVVRTLLPAVEGGGILGNEHLHCNTLGRYMGWPDRAMLHEASVDSADIFVAKRRVTGILMKEISWCPDATESADSLALQDRPALGVADQAPKTCSETERVRGPSSSARMILCQVPRTTWPPRTASMALAPKRSARRWDTALPRWQSE